MKPNHTYYENLRWQDGILNNASSSLTSLDDVYKKNSERWFSKKKLNPSSYNKNSGGRESEVLVALVQHPNVSPQMVSKIAKHSDPWVRLSTLGSPLLSEVMKTNVYSSIIGTNGYGNLNLLLAALCKNSIPRELKNRKLQDVFQKSKFVMKSNRYYGDSSCFEEELINENMLDEISNQNFNKDPSKSVGKEYFDYMDSILEIEKKLIDLRESITGLEFCKDLDTETIKSIIASKHGLGIFSLSKNVYLTPDQYQLILEYSETKEDVELLECLAGNISVSEDMLSSLVQIAMKYDYSFYRAGSKYGEFAKLLAGNPRTPIKSLLILRSLYDDEGYKAYMGDAKLPVWEQPPLVNILYFQVESNPAFKQWVMDTPYYEELLPPLHVCSICNENK